MAWRKRNCEKKGFYVALCDALRDIDPGIAKGVYAAFSENDAREAMSIAVTDQEYGEHVIKFLLDHRRRDYLDTPYGPVTPMPLRNIPFKEILEELQLSDEIRTGDAVKVWTPKNKKIEPGMKIYDIPKKMAQVINLTDIKPRGTIKEGEK